MSLEDWMFWDSLIDSRGKPMRGGPQAAPPSRPGSPNWAEKMMRVWRLPPWEKPLATRATSSRNEFFRRLTHRHDLERPNGTMETHHGPLPGPGPSYRPTVFKEPQVADFLVPSGSALMRPRNRLRAPAFKRLPNPCWED